MPRADFAAANAIFVDEDFVAVFLLEPCEHFEVGRIIRVNHHFIEALGKFAVIIGVPASVFDGNLQNGRDAFELGVIFPDVFEKGIGSANNRIVSGRVLFVKKGQKRVPGRIFEVFFLEKVIGECEVDGDSPFCVGEPGVAHLLGSAGGTRQNAPAVPKEKRRAVHEFEYFYSGGLQEKVVKKQEFAVVDKSSGNVPKGIGPKRIYKRGILGKHIVVLVRKDTRERAFPQSFFIGEIREKSFSEIL